MLWAVAHHGCVQSRILFPDHAKPQRPIKKDTDALAMPSVAVCPTLWRCVSLAPADSKRLLQLGIAKVKNNIASHSPIHRRRITVSWKNNTQRKKVITRQFNVITAIRLKLWQWRGFENITWELGFKSENWDSLPNPATEMYDLKLITKPWLVQMPWTMCRWFCASLSP